MNNRKYLLQTALVFMLLVIASITQAQKADRAAFYKALASTSTSAIDAQLKSAENGSGNDNEAFEGALLMRKAGLAAIPAKKVQLFKQGHRKLEAVIARDNDNVEYRFLRLMIQENAPRSLGYNKNMADDSRIIKAGFKSLPAITQQSVLNYSKKSKSLPSSAL